MSAYYALREANIAQNQAALSSLGIRSKQLQHLIIMSGRCGGSGGQRRRTRRL